METTALPGLLVGDEEKSWERWRESIGSAVFLGTVTF